MRILVAATVCTAIFAAYPAWGGTQFAVRKITIAGATSINATALNGKGLIVGNETDENGEHGFILDKTNLTILPNPMPSCTSTSVYPSAINEAGNVVGADLCLGNPTTFLYNQDAYVQAASVNMGVGAGVLFVGLSAGGREVFNHYVGSGNYTPYEGKPPNFKQLAPLSVGSIVLSLNNGGTPAGLTYEGCGIDGTCVFVGGGAHLINIYPPGAVTASGGYINDAGQVAGTYATSYPGLSSGFVYANGQYTVFDAPGRADTMSVLAINKSGRVVGVYAAAGKPQHGFLYNGSTVTKFGEFPAADRIGMAINGHGEILVSDTAGSTATSYTVRCAGSGC